MIVADANLVVYLYLPGPCSEMAERVRQADCHWLAPRLWRSEFRSVLAVQMRAGRLGLADALAVAARAEALVDTPTAEVPSRQILELAQSSRCTAYDCEYVALAQTLGVPLVTGDRQVLEAFPGTALSLQDFLKG